MSARLSSASPPACRGRRPCRADRLPVAPLVAIEPGTFPIPHGPVPARLPAAFLPSDSTASVISGPSWYASSSVRTITPLLFTLALTLPGVLACQPSNPVKPSAVSVPGPSSSAIPALPYASVTIDGIPHVQQRPDFGGEACLEMALRWQGSSVDQDQVFEASGLDPSLGRGVHAQELRVAIEHLGFAPSDASGTVAANDPGPLEAQWAALHTDLLRKVPSIVCTRINDRGDTTEHFRLVVGYDQASDEVLYHDPAVVGGAYLRMPRGRFLSLWPLEYAADRWTVIRLPLVPLQVRKSAPPVTATSPARVAQHVMQLWAKIGTSGFTVLVEPPFVVIGDEPAPVVKQRAESIVRWAVTRLRRDFFERDPDRLLDIWLFRDAASYEANTQRLLHRRPPTPYGFYAAESDALWMNIATGGGTLVHEIVHPFMEANFPQCPPWFNEGLGSLYEQCEDRNGHIWGLTNWRLESLQKAIRSASVPPFESLMAADATTFYEQDPGTHYAQARYLCYYLQEKGLLRRFYREFLANSAADPTGVQTLRSVLGQQDLSAFKRQWEQWVLGLRLP